MHTKQMKIWKSDRGIFQYIITKIIQKKNRENLKRLVLPWRNVLLEKLTVARVVYKRSALKGN